VQSPTPQPGDAEGVVVGVLFIVALCVAYWRTALQMLAIALITLAVLGVILAVLGVIDTVHGLHHLVG
jgi:CDP-diglyceride synthetase